MIKWLICLFLISLSLSCKQEEKINYDMEVTIRPIVINRSWTEYQVQNKLKDMHSSLKYTGIKIKILPVYYISESWETIEIMRDEGKEMSRRSSLLYEQGELVFWFCQNITINGSVVGGAAYLHPNHGIWISASSCNNVCTHEFGHAFSLSHTEPLSGKEVECRIMSYSPLACTSSFICDKKRFIPEEVQLMRDTALTLRIKVVNVLNNIITKQDIVAPDTNGELIWCNP